MYYDCCIKSCIVGTGHLIEKHKSKNLMLYTLLEKNLTRRKFCDKDFAWLKITYSRKLLAIRNAFFFNSARTLQT
jgi:hypothetical protein